jgi:hypothetical protein
MLGVVSNVTYRFHRHWHEGTPITFCRGDWAFASDVVEDVYGIRTPLIVEPVPIAMTNSQSAGKKSLNVVIFPFHLN